MPTDLATQLGAYFATHGAGVACAYLFGSRARGDHNPNSDLDVAVLFEQPPPQTLDGLGLDLAADLREITGLPVDLVVLNRASPDLVHRVLHEGVLVHEASRSARVQFEVRSRAEYFDLLPYILEYRRRSEDRTRDRS